jgi:hypothetical protein
MGAAAPLIGAIAGQAIGSALGYAAVGAYATTALNAAIGRAVGGMIGSMIGSSLGQAVFGKEPELPDYSTPLQDRGFLINSRNSVANINIIYGARQVGGNHVFMEASGTDNEYLHIVTVLGEGEIDSVTNIYLNDVLSTDSKFSGYVETTVHTGSDSQAADSNLVSRIASWTSSHRLQGTAYIYTRLKYDQDVFPGGVPTITADVKGRKVYDPRTSSTAWSDNPALCIRDYLTNTRYGRGIASSLIDDTSFNAAANYCDETVTIGGESVKRYTTNGVADTSRTSLENIKELLTACRGFLVFSGGKYKLVIDKPETATFTFDEDNIIGAWSIGLGNKQNTYNRIRVNFYNPARSWQPDVTAVESTALRTIDNGLLLEREIELPFTSSEPRAKAIATMNLNQSRQQVSCEFTATIEGMRCEVGDVVYISHKTPGWDTLNSGAGKKFRIIEIAMQSTDEVRVKALEYDETVYDFGTIPASDPTPNTNLPDPFTVALPGLPAVSEEIYVTREGAGVKAKAILTWTAAPDIFVRQYEVQYKLTSASTYTSAGTTSGTTFDVLDIAPGTYDFRVKAINSIGVSSGWKTTTHEIFGLLAKPSALTNLTLSAVSSMAVLTWDQSVDLDVRIGGKIEIRHSSLTSGASWANSVSLGSGSSLNGTATFAVLTLVEGTYLVRAVDSSGIKSDTVSISTDAATALAYTTLTTITESPTFPGVKSDVRVEDSLLRLAGQETMDEWSDVDALASWDIGEGGIDQFGYYLFDTGYDYGSVSRIRLTRKITSTLAQPLDQMDSRTALMDSWADFDGTDAAAGDCRVFVRHTDDDPTGSPTWSNWELLTVNEYNHRAFEFKAELSVNDPAYNIRVSELSVTASEI